MSLGTAKALRAVGIAGTLMTVITLRKAKDVRTAGTLETLEKPRPLGTATILGQWGYSKQLGNLGHLIKTLGIAGILGT